MSTEGNNIQTLSEKRNAIISNILELLELLKVNSKKIQLLKDDPLLKDDHAELEKLRQQRYPVFLQLQNDFNSVVPVVKQTFTNNQVNDIENEEIQTIFLENILQFQYFIGPEKYTMILDFLGGYIKKKLKDNFREYMRRKMKTSIQETQNGNLQPNENQKIKKRQQKKSNQFENDIQEKQNPNLSPKQKMSQKEKKKFKGTNSILSSHLFMSFLNTHMFKLLFSNKNYLYGSEQYIQLEETKNDFIKMKDEIIHQKYKTIWNRYIEQFKRDERIEKIMFMHLLTIIVEAYTSEDHIQKNSGSPPNGLLALFTLLKMYPSQTKIFDKLHQCFYFLFEEDMNKFDEGLYDELTQFQNMSYNQQNYFNQQQQTIKKSRQNVAFEDQVIQDRNQQTILEQQIKKRNKINPNINQENNLEDRNYQQFIDLFDQVANGDDELKQSDNQDKNNQELDVSFNEIGKFYGSAKKQENTQFSEFTGQKTMFTKDYFTEQQKEWESIVFDKNIKLCDIFFFKKNYKEQQSKLDFQNQQQNNLQSITNAHQQPTGINSNLQQLQQQFSQSQSQDDQQENKNKDQSQSESQKKSEDFDSNF